MVLNVHRNHKANCGRGGGGGGGESVYLSLRCHHQNDSCIKMGSDENRFDVSLIVRDKVKRQCPKTTTFEEKRKPKRIRTTVPLLTSLSTYRWAKPAHKWAGSHPQTCIVYIVRYCSSHSSGAV